MPKKMSRRLRFTDTDYKASPRAYHQQHPCANIAVPDLGTVKKVLNSELNADAQYNLVWEQAKLQLSYKKKTLPPDCFKSSTPEECYIAVVAYTMDTTLYSNFNKKFREMTSKASWTSFPYKSFYYLLTLSQNGIKHDRNVRLYRGMAKVHLNPGPEPGQFFYFDYFASCSMDEGVALDFMGADGTLIEIQNGAETAMDITKYSEFDEREDLVSPKNQFLVIRIEQTTTPNKIVTEKIVLIRESKSQDYKFVGADYHWETLEEHIIID